MPRFKIVFEGHILPGRDPAEVKRDFMRKFRVSEHRAELFFSGSSFDLKKNLSEIDARKLAAAIGEVGAGCRVEVDGEVGEEWSTEDPFQSPREADRPTAVVPPPSLTLDRAPAKPWAVQDQNEQDEQPAPWEDPRAGAGLGQARRQFLEKEEAKRRMPHRERLVFFGGLAGLFFVLFLFGAKLWVDHVPVRQPPGVLAADPPVQIQPRNREPFVFKDHMLRPLAEISLEARVLSRKNYRSDRAARISPIDLALGWGRMSDSDVLRGIQINQTSRFALWRYQRAPIPRREIDLSIANMHMIPSNPVISRRLKGVREGHLIRLRGKLVGVTAPDGFVWESSLTREDSGDGACEIVWVEDFEIL